MRGADLRDANLSGARLEGANLNGAIQTLSKIPFRSGTIWPIGFDPQMAGVIAATE